MKQENALNPRIYVACLAAYNSGYLHGKWIDADQDADDIMSDIMAMLESSPIENAEEWAIHDYEGFGALQIREYVGIASVAEIAEFLIKYGVLGSEVAAHLGADLSEAREAMEDRYIGCFGSLADYLAELTEETTEIPKNLIYYIDYDAMARDAEINGDFFTVNLSGNLHVFAGG